MNIFQDAINGMNQRLQAERAQTQMTLGKFIALLEGLPSGSLVSGLGSLISYRGYYSDLAFIPTNATVTRETMLDLCRAAVGQTFEGYKGGDYTMGASTPLWVADYGESSCPRLMGLEARADGVFRPVVAEEPDDE